MTRISSSIGLITGIPIEETVKKLMEVAARPRELLNARNQELKQQQVALDTLGSRLLSFQFSVNKLKAPSVYQARELTSSNPDALEAKLSAGKSAAVGSFLVRPVRAASSQQLVSQSFGSAQDAFDGGTLSLRYGGFVDKGLSLDELNGGAGVSRGKIRITDRSGASTTIDLGFARTVDDVLDAINSHTDVAVTATTNGGAFVLTDASGGTGNLRVQELGAGTTAARLGLAGINAANSQVAGSDIVRLSAATNLATLNDGNGVQVTANGVVDVEIGLADGTQLAIDLSDATTLGDVIDQLNAASPAKLAAIIHSDGRRIQLTDLTSGGNQFTVENGAASTAAGDLGIVADAAAATIAGDRLIAGLRDTLLSSLNGGEGLGPLGVIDITDSAGGAATVNLANAETLGDVLNLINASAANVTASINVARNGIVITDVSGGSGDLVIANGDATNSATALGIAVDDAVKSINSGTLHRQTLSAGTLLSSLNGGKGVVLGDIRVTDSDGIAKSADLNTFGREAKTVGDVINAINALGHGVEARINDAGDGILLINSAQGNHALGVADLAGDVARSLNLTRASKTLDVNGAPTQVIDGTATYSVDLDDLDDVEASAASTSLKSLNNGAGVVAGAFVISDSNGGNSVAIDLDGADGGIATVGQLIDAINAKAQSLGVGVVARINNAGTGILLEDTAGGSGKLTVRDVDSTAAASLKIAGEAKIQGGKQTINGAGAFTAPKAAASGLHALAARINSLDAGVAAGVAFDGVGYRLSLSGNATGAANELLVDLGDTGLQLEEVSPAQDALLLYGNVNSPGSGLLVSSPDGKFSDAIGGVDLAVKAGSDAPVTITVDQTDNQILDAFKEVVEAYNALRTDLDKLTSFDADALTTGLLFGTNEALQIDSRLSLAMTDRYFGLGAFQSLEQIGLSVANDGTLELDEAKLREAFEADPAGLEKFLTDGQRGAAVKLGAVVDRLAGAKESLLAARSGSLQEKIAANQNRIDRFDLQLERQQERLFLEFFQLESVIASMQASLTAIQNLQVLPPLSSASVRR